MFLGGGSQDFAPSGYIAKDTDHKDLENGFQRQTDDLRVGEVGHNE